jgi:hypothetical protein
LPGRIETRPLAGLPLLILVNADRLHFGKTGGKPPVGFREANGISRRSFRKLGRGLHRRFLGEAARPLSGDDGHN